MMIYQDQYLSPDYFEIVNWNNPQKDAKPVWMQMWIVNGKAFVHPSIYNKFSMLR